MLCAMNPYRSMQAGVRLNCGNEVYLGMDLLEVFFSLYPLVRDLLRGRVVAIDDASDKMAVVSLV